MQKGETILGVSGRSKSGKTAVCDYLASEYRYSHFEISDPIADDLDKWLVPKGVRLGKYKKDDYRLLLQGWGHLARLEWGEDCWIKRVLAGIVPPAVIGGIRYVCEVEEIRRQGGRVLRVVRAGAENKDTAPTETQLDRYDKFDAVVENNGSLEELHLSVDQILKEWLWT